MQIMDCGDNSCVSSWGTIFAWLYRFQSSNCYDVRCNWCNLSSVLAFLHIFFHDKEFNFFRDIFQDFRGYRFFFKLESFFTLDVLFLEQIPLC